ncbi:MAG: LynF/TruF/PatF family peptide O-prenyltransferase [Symploca sp. SIO3C6]|nr:LynF/TruF/PatF family peptide O-prenyltransferase [Symploca sp. SIO3C6]
MITANNVSIDSDKNLRYLGEHKRIFGVENLYPLELFENFVQARQDCLIDCACKIDQDKLHAARFSLAFVNQQDAKEQIRAALNFFGKVERRIEVKLNYQLLQEFLGIGFDFTKVIKILVGVDARREITDSRLKLFIWIDDYPEKLETAIALAGDSQDLRLLLVNNQLLVGFDFWLDGRNAIELYPTISAEEWQRVDVRQRLTTVFSPPALRLLDDCYKLQIGFSQANESKILYFHALEPSNFVDNLGNDLASRIDAYYRHQPVKALVVSIPESELLAGSIQKLNMYYGV